MTITRRRFLTYALAAAGAAGAGGLLTLMRRQSQPGWQAVDLGGGITRLELPPLDQESGALEPSALAALMAVVDVFVEGRGAVDHYRTYLTWRAQNLPGYRSLYESFSAGLQGTAREGFSADFAELDRDTRRDMLQRGLGLPLPDSPLTETLIATETAAALTDADVLWLCFDRYIIAELVTLYIKTNAWLMLGYDGWPSQARGLERYVQPPPGASSRRTEHTYG